MIQKLRNNEYFGLQSIFDHLYEESKKGRYFKNIYELIISEENIRLAFRNLKSNTGSKTKGTNGHTIKHLNKIDADKLIRLTKKRLENYMPHAVRRVFIPKPNGKMRPLGIPTIEDRLIQQMFLQILEPIVEAKFHPQSYGFRPKRSTHDALARCYHMVNHSHQHFVVDIDIKGFFDNVNHKKLMRQLWTIGINEIRHKVHPNIKSLMFRNIFVYTKETNNIIDKFYGDYNCPRFKSNGLLVYPIEAIRHDIRGQRDPNFSVYNKKDRASIHKEIKRVSVREIEMFRKGIYKTKSVLYENNRLSKYVAQKGCCGITGERLTPHNAICHHIKPTGQGGSDECHNLIIINRKYHMLIHNKDPLANEDYKKMLGKFDKKALSKLNKLRTEVGNPQLSL
ncbi:TPA: hypothetical protein QCU59_000605 [Bacillus cereus]|nr:hypothetical protein [Bacillus cereus]